MKKTKLLICLLLVLVLACAFAGCINITTPTEVPTEKPTETPTPEDPASENTMVGTISDVTMDTIKVKNQSGNEFVFSTVGAEMDITNGIEIGNMVEVTYTGHLDVASTTLAATKVVDNTDNTAAETEKVEIKAETLTMYATKGVHVRESWSTDSAIIASITKGTEVQVTGKSDNGWFRIEYNSKDAYIAQAYLSEQKPAADDDQPETAPPTPDSGAQTSSAQGTITYCDGTTILIKMESKEYQFMLSQVKVKLSGGLYEGEAVQIIYSGNLDNNPVLHEITDPN